MTDQISFLDEDYIDDIDDGKYKCFTNKIVNIEFNQEELFNDYQIVNIRLACFDSNKEKYNYSYRQIFNKDQEFYCKYLMSVTIKAGNSMYIMFDKTNNNIDFKKKLMDDCDRRDDFIFEDIKYIDKERYHNFLNLLMLATIKITNKNIPYFINDSYEYVQKIKGKDGDKNIEVFIPKFKCDYGKDNNYTVYFDYSVKNMKKVEKNLAKRIENHKLYGVFNKDIFTHYDSIIEENEYTFLAKYKNAKTTLDEVVLYVNKQKGIDPAKRKFYNSKQMRMHKIIDDIKMYFSDYVNFEFEKLNRYDYFEHDKEYKKIKNHEYKKIIEGKIRGKTIAVIDNVNSLSSKAFTSELENFTYKLGVKVSVFYENLKNKESDYLINITYLPEYYENKNLKDEYLYHDLKTPTKNLNVEEITEKKIIISKPALRQQIRGMLFSLIVEEEIIKGQSDILKLSNYPNNTSFIIYKNTYQNKYFIMLTLKSDGAIKFESYGYNNLDQDLSEYGYELKYRLDQMANIDYNDEMFIVINDEINILRKEILKPIIDKQAYRDIFVDDNINNKDKISHPDFFETKNKDGVPQGNFTLSQRRKSVTNYQHYGYMNIKKINNVYFSGYIDKNLRANLPNSPRARSVVGKNSDDLIFKFIDEQYNEFKSMPHRYGVSPLVLKYLNTFKRIIDKNKEQEEL